MEGLVESMNFRNKTSSMLTHHYQLAHIQNGSDLDQNNNNSTHMNSNIVSPLYSSSSCHEFSDDDIDMTTMSKADRIKRIIDNSGRKRRIYSNIHSDPKQSTRRFRANDRERRRMNSLNGALQALKGCVPSYHGKKRLTKLQILKFACHYISDLSDILCSPGSDGNTSLSSISMSDSASSTAANDCNYSDGCVDAFMNFMSEQHQQEMLDIQQEHTSQVDMTSGVQNNINGLSMMQRLDYLTFHSYMAATDDENLDLNISTLPQGHSEMYSPNNMSAGVSPDPNNNNNMIYSYH